MAENTELRRLKRQLFDVQSELSQLCTQVATNKSRTEWDLDDQADRLQRLEEKVRRSGSPTPREDDQAYRLQRLEERAERSGSPAPRSWVLSELSLSTSTILMYISFGFLLGVVLTTIIG